MTSLALGVLAALAASALYAVAVALQALEARAVPVEHSQRFSLLRKLARRPRWLGGTAIGLAGWACQALAVALAPVTLVQPLLATTLAFLLLAGRRFLGEGVGRRELAAVAAIVAATPALAWAAPAHELRHVQGATLAASTSGLAAAAAAAWLVSRATRSGWLMAVGAGLAYGLDGLATKLFTDDVRTGAWAVAVGWLAVMGAAAGVGTTSEMSALQVAPATRVAPLLYAVNTLAPVALAPVLLHERWPSAAGPLAALVAAIAAIVCAATALARAPGVAAVLDAEASLTAS